MAQSGPAPSVHPRRHRPEHNPTDSNAVNNGPSSLVPSGGRYGETEWEARDVNIQNIFLLYYLDLDSHVLYF